MDFLIRNGTVFDGSGAAPGRMDVAVGGGMILAVAENIPARAGVREIDAEGLAVAPGFIDLHSHSDESLVVDPRADSKIRQGVTTEVIGNCGFSAAPLEGRKLDEMRQKMRERYGASVPWRTFGEYLFHVSSLGLSANCVALIGHGTLRHSAVGLENRPATEGERVLMAQMLEQAMLEGAWGLSSGLIYVPSSFGSEKEIIALARIVRRYNGMYSTHVRSEGDRLVEAVEEALRVSREAEVMVEISHHKASGLSNWGKVEKTLALLEQARKDGLSAFCDQYPYTASSTTMRALLPLWAVEGDQGTLLQRLLDFDQRKRIRETLENHPYGDWSRVQIASVKHEKGQNKSYEGLTVAQLARSLNKSGADVVMDLLLEEDGEVNGIFFSMCDEDVERVMRDPHTAIGSDAGAALSSGPLAGGKPHPRGFGTFPRVLGRYVREKGVLTMEDAIHRMTGMPAQRLGLADRGFVRAEHWADIVVFDPAKVNDRATYTDPHEYPAGILHVLVNGKLVVHNRKPTGDLPGKMLRRGQDGSVNYW
ncbi:MAG: D-aminoacylase [Armatimonadetes bacterium]|nr:D-aminoacylase [Armatimonadota bacterium]